MTQNIYQQPSLNPNLICLIDDLPAPEPTVDDVQKAMAGDQPGATRKDAVSLLKSLDSQGWGKFLAGRRGRQSRFRWGRDAKQRMEELRRQVPSTRSKGTTEPATQPNPKESSGSAEVISHQFVLRPDFLVRLELPNNLSSVEAERLGMFLRSLPMMKAESMM